MCKFIFGIIFSIFMMGIISCSGQDESTNLTIAIDMSGLLPSNESKDSFARSVDDEKWKLEVTLIDLEDENNIIPPISVPIIDDKASVTFEKIPLFFKGRIEAIIFEGETPKFTGKSEEFIVHEGRNRISVHMEEVDNPGAPVDPEDPTEPDDPEDPADPNDPNDPNQPGDGTGDDSGETGGDNPTDPGNPEEPDDPTEPGNPGDDPEIGETEKTAKYTVKHYQQNIDDDEYTLVETDTEEETGIVGAKTSAEAKEYEGFEEGVVEQKTIAEDGSTVVQIMYDRKVITLTFDTKGGSDVNAIEGKYGAQITDSIVTTKTGYVFVAWDKTLPETFPATDTTFIAQWTPITYTVVFDTGVDDDSVSGEMNSLPCTYDVPNVLPKNEFTRANFDFNGWNTNEDGSGYSYQDEAEVKNLSSTQNAVVTLYAQWHSQSQVKSVDFSVAGGYVDSGTVVTLSCETEGATIYYKEGNAEVFSKYNGEIEIKNDVTITAYATKEGMVDSEINSQTYTLNSYTVTLKLNGGSLNETITAIQNIYSGATFDLSKCIPSKTGYTFGGWELNGEIVNTVKVTNADVELTATWTPITYTVVFDTGVDDGSVRDTMDSLPCTYDEPNVLPKNEFTRENFDFNGWNTEKDGSGTSYTDEQEVENLASTQNAVVTLYAQWHSQSQVREVKFSVNGGDVNYGTNVTLSCETAGATIYYTFVETEYFSEDWTMYEDVAITIFGENDDDLQKTLRAIAIADGMTNSEINSQTYTLSSYNVTLNPNGGSLNETISATQNIYSGATFDLSNCIPSKTGYTFGGWELNGDIVNTVKVTNANIELTAKWTPITYKVVFNANGGETLPSGQSQTFTYDVSQNLNENEFTRDGYTFVRWNTEEDGSGTPYADKQEVKNLASTQDAVVTLYAQWEKIKSTIEIEFNGYSDVSFDEDDVTNDGSTITITIPSGYSVVAWEKDGVTINDSEGQNSITVSEWDGGIYTVTIIFKDDAGNFYSDEMQVTINKVNRAN